MPPPPPAQHKKKSDLEAYLISTFNKVEDQYGQKLDILPALPTLVEVLSGTPNANFAEKKYEFVGEAACQFAIRCIVAKQFNTYDNRILDALAKKFRTLQQVNKLVLKEIQLKQHVSQKLPSTIIQTISGILYSYFGTPAVEKFIENAVLEIASNELGEARIMIAANNSLQQYHELIHKEGGMMEAQALETPDKQWQVKVISKLKSTSILFSHTRVALSKQKAKQAACLDILLFLKDHQDVFQQLQIENIDSPDVHPLPIEETDYTEVQEATLKPKITTRSTTTTYGAEGDDDSYIHIPFSLDEDAIRQLSRLLLGESGSEDETMGEGDSPTKKRMRDMLHPQNTGVEGMFSSSYYGNTTTTSPSQPPAARAAPAPPAPQTQTQTSLKQEPIIKSDPVDLEAAQKNLINSLSASSSTSSTSQPKVRHKPSTPMATVPTSPTNTQADFPVMEDHHNSFNPFVGAPHASEQVEVSPRVISYYKKIFQNNRSAMLQAITMAGQCKSILLSLVQQHTDKLVVECKTQQIGPPHGPVFSAEVVLKSKEYGNCTIKTEAVSRRKKDAEMHAFHKLCCMMK